MSVPAYCFDLSQGSQLYATSPILFLTLVNAYLQKCTPKEHQSLISDKKYLRFFLCQDAVYLPFYSYGYLRNIDECLPEHKVRLQSCPSDYVSCELNSFHLGYFIFVKKSACITKSEIGREDIILGD